MIKTYMNVDSRSLDSANTTMDRLMDTLHQQFVNTQNKAINDVLIPQMLKNATPKLKLPLTAGKLKWRGIVMKIKQDSQEYRYHIEQRGTRITSEIVLTCKFTDNKIMFE